MILLDLPQSYNYYVSLFDFFGVKPRIEHKTQSPEVARVLVAQGLGYSILSMPTRHSVAMDGSEFVILPLANDPPNLRIGLVMGADTIPTYGSRICFELAQDNLKSFFYFK